MSPSPDSQTVIFTADAHIGPGDVQGKHLFSAFMDHFSTRVDRMFILGDLFNAWLGNVDDNLPAYDEVFDACERFTHHAQLGFVHGNRDFAMGKRFPRGLPVKVFRKPVLLRASGWNIYACHGHNLGRGDISFSLLKLLFHNNAFVCFNNLMPRKLREYCASNLRNISKRKQIRNNRPAVVLNDKKLMQIFSDGTDLIIGGHYHKPIEREYTVPGEDGPQTRKLLLVDQWQQTAPYIMIDKEGKITRDQFSLNEK